MNNETCLTVKNLTKRYTATNFLSRTPRSTFTAVSNVSFELKKREILGLLGPNGAGKTTTISMLLGILTPTSGNIMYFDQDFARNRSAILEKVGYASAYVKLPGRLTVEENLYMYAYLYGVASQNTPHRITQLLKRFGISHLRNKIVATLSAGQLTRAMLAKAFLANPEIVLLDEPTASLDPDIAHEVLQFILEQRDELGTAILYTSHNMEEVTEICDRVLVLKNGTIFAENTPDALAASISESRVHLLFKDSDLPRAINFAQQEKIAFTVAGNYLTLEIKEHEIAALLNKFAHAGIPYTHISIDKPSLKDYFLHIARAQ